MKKKSVIITLSVTIAILASVAASVGLFLKGEGSSYLFETLHGQTVLIKGHGLYARDTLFIAAGFRGADAALLFFGVPLLIAAIFAYRRESLPGQMLLMGVLGYFLYFYASMALGAAYNSFFLLYIALFSASLFAFVMLFSSISLPERLEKMPRRGLIVFMIAAGLVTLFAWLSPLIAALTTNTPPDRMDSYTTMVTYALDLAIITPTVFVTAGLVRKNNPLGYKTAMPLLTIIILLVPQIILGTIFQRAAGIVLSPGEMIGPVAGFVMLGLLAFWLLGSIIRHLPEQELN